MFISLSQVSVLYSMRFSDCCSTCWRKPSKLLVTLICAEEQKFSKDGYEQHMQVNHLAPALLSLLLLPSLIRGTPSRIINVNSVVSIIIAETASCITLSSSFVVMLKSLDFLGIRSKQTETLNFVYTGLLHCFSLCEILLWLNLNKNNNVLFIVWGYPHLMQDHCLLGLLFW